MTIARVPAKNLYNLASFDKAAAYAKTNFKDEGGIILARNLEHVSAEIFTQEYAGLTFMSSGIVVNNEGAYATSIRKLKLGISGGFRDSGTNTNTTGKITLTGEDDDMKVFTAEAESDWSEIELKQAELEGVNLAGRYFDAHNEIYNRDLDELGYLGKLRSDGSVRVAGLLNYSGFATDAASGKAETLSGDDLYNEIATAITTQWSNNFNVEAYMASRFVMSPRAYNATAQKILNSNGSSKAVLAALKENFPTVEFLMTSKAEGVGAASVGVAYSTNRKAMQFRLPNPLQVSAVHQRGFKYYVESFYGVAGLDIIEDGAAYILTGL